MAALNEFADGEGPPLVSSGDTGELCKSTDDRVKGGGSGSEVCKVRGVTVASSPEVGNELDGCRSGCLVITEDAGMGALALLGNGGVKSMIRVLRCLKLVERRLALERGKPNRFWGLVC